jgi:alkylation response protein AidB-like acyl-CoA dehydrogenase
MNFYSDSKEWKYLFKNSVDWDRILPLYYPSYPTTDGLQNKEEVLNFFEEILSSTGKWTGESVAPRAKHLDEIGAGKVENGQTIPSAPLLQTYKEAKELGAFGLSIDQKYGGMGLPFTVSLMAMAQTSRACLSTSTQLGFFSSIADMVDRFCDEQDRNHYIPKIVDGLISGSMCLTEPNAGSDVGSLQTTAIKQNDGSYQLFGQKCFITNAGGGLGFVLARIKGAPQGLEGISIFFAPEWIEENGVKKHNYHIVKNEKKMGLHGSFTCEVVYEGTKAKLVGEEHQGMKVMFHLMNEARIGVGLQTLGTIEACLHYARQYGETRTQFGKPLTELPLFKRNLEDWETELDAFRCLMMDTIADFDIFSKLDLDKRHGKILTESEKTLLKEVSKSVRRRTPLVKFYGAETCTTLTTKAIQALGGYGFMQEYEAERFHRDSFAPLLYEGTSQIQALMALKDLMKYIMKNPANFFLSTIGHTPLLSIGQSKNEVEKTFSQIQYQFKTKLMALLIKCLKPEQIDKIFDFSSWQDEKRMSELMTHAETICFCMSYIETLRVLMKHALKDQERSALYFRYLKLIQPRLKGIYCDWKQA